MLFFLKTPVRLLKIWVSYRSFLLDGVWTRLYMFDNGLY